MLEYEYFSKHCKLIAIDLTKQIESLWLFRPIYSCNRNVTTTAGDANTRVTFKNCAPFMKCITHINDKHVDNADNLDIVMPMYNLIECSDNHSENSVYGSLKRWITYNRY